MLTEQLLLRTWSPEDVDALDEIYRQPEYLRTMPAANAAEQIVTWSRRWEEDGFAQWAACERESGRLIGRIGLLRHHDWPLVSEPVETGGFYTATSGGGGWRPRAAGPVWKRGFVTWRTTPSTASPSRRTHGRRP